MTVRLTKPAVITSDRRFDQTHAIVYFTAGQNSQNNVAGVIAVADLKVSTTHEGRSIVAGVNAGARS